VLANVDQSINEQMIFDFGTVKNKNVYEGADNRREHANKEANDPAIYRLLVQILLNTTKIKNKNWFKITWKSLVAS
jgi:hypothetical protein